MRGVLADKFNKSDGRKMAYSLTCLEGKWTSGRNIHPWIATGSAIANAIDNAIDFAINLEVDHRYYIFNFFIFLFLAVSTVQAC